MANKNTKPKNDALCLLDMAGMIGGQPSDEEIIDELFGSPPSPQDGFSMHKGGEVAPPIKNEKPEWVYLVAGALGYSMHYLNHVFTTEEYEQLMLKQAYRIVEAHKKGPECPRCSCNPCRCASLDEADAIWKQCMIDIAEENEASKKRPETGAGAARGNRGSCDATLLPPAPAANPSPSIGQKNDSETGKGDSEQEQGQIRIRPSGTKTAPEPSNGSLQASPSGDEAGPEPTDYCKLIDGLLEQACQDSWVTAGNNWPSEDIAIVMGAKDRAEAARNLLFKYRIEHPTKSMGETYSGYPLYVFGSIAGVAVMDIRVVKAMAKWRQEK